MIIIHRSVFVEMEAVSVFKQIVDMAGYSVFSFLHNRQLTYIRLQQLRELCIGRLTAFEVETLLSVSQFADKPMMMREVFVVAPYE